MYRTVHPPASDDMPACLSCNGDCMFMIFSKLGSDMESSGQASDVFSAAVDAPSTELLPLWYGLIAMPGARFCKLAFRSLGDKAWSTHSSWVGKDVSVTSVCDVIAKASWQMDFEEEAVCFENECCVFRILPWCRAPDLFLKTPVNSILPGKDDEVLLSWKLRFLSSLPWSGDGELLSWAEPEHRSRSKSSVSSLMSRTSEGDPMSVLRLATRLLLCLSLLCLDWKCWSSWVEFTAWGVQGGVESLSPCNQSGSGFRPEQSVT